jgi:F-type H+-transporting ATPase subunit b
MHVSAWSVALQIINFLVLAWLLGRFLFKPVAKVIDARQKEIEARLGEVAAERERAREAEAKHEAARAAVAAEARREIDEARRRGEQEAHVIREEAERKVREHFERVRAELAAERARALGEVRTQATELAIAIAERLLAEVTARPGLLAGVMQSVSDPEQKRMMAQQLDDGRVDVVSASPLADAEQQRLRAWLAELAGRPVDASFQVDPSLLAGVELRFPYGSVRYSARALLARIAAGLKERDGAA